MDFVTLVVVAVLAFVLVAVFIMRQKAEYGAQLQQLQPKKPKQFGIYTTEEVAKHNKPDDAWIIAQHKETKEYRVYDITEYVPEHPGGESILRNIGGDATEGFHGPQHPVTTFLLADEYCIGKLAEGEEVKFRSKR